MTMTPAFAIDLTAAAATPPALALTAALGPLALPVFFDDVRGHWRCAAADDLARLFRPPGRLAGWSSRLRRLTGRARGRPLPEECLGFIEPGLFSADVARALPALFASVRGPRVARLHALSPLQHPESTPPALVARLAAYAHELRMFDGIVADSEDARTELLDYWRWLGFPASPPVVALAAENPSDLIAWIQSLPAR
jgi:hypothetical protein